MTACAPCEAFVEPESVPPLHGHKVAEPLVGELVADRPGDGLLGGGGGGCLVHQQPGLSVGDAPPVLHRPCRKV